MALTTYIPGEVLTAVSLNDNLAYAVTVPAAVPGGLVCVKAETTVTAAASATADSIFTSSYTNYLLLLNYTTSTTQAIEMQFRVGGVSATTNYTYQTMQGFGTTPSTNPFSAQSSAAIGYYANTAQQYAVINIGNVQLAKATSYSTQGGALAGALHYAIQGTHTTATAYDGINILVASGTWTGTYAIYGYSKTV